MALPASPFKYTYGGQSVGGDHASFHLNGAHRTGKHHDRFFFEFVVSVQGPTTRADFQNQCEILEDAFKKRDQSLTVDLDNVDDPGGSSTWAYVVNEDLLNVESEIEKVGDDDEDHGLTRDYFIRITADMPSQDTLTISGVGYFTGLRDIEYDVHYEPGRQKIVTMSGIYTATPAQTSPSRTTKTARENYTDTTTGGAGTGADQEWDAYVARFSGDTFELIVEDPREDRQTNTLEFTRTYRELLVNQNEASLDAANIRDHDFHFEEVIDQPGDSLKNVSRMRTVIGRYSCAIDIEKGVVLETIFDDEIAPHVLALFQTRFSPKTFCIRNRTTRYDQTRQRIETSLIFLYQKQGGDALVQIRSSVRVRTIPGHEFIAMHEANPYAMEVAEGHAVKLRTTTVSTQTVGDDDSQDSGPGAGGTFGRGSGGRRPSGPGFGKLRGGGFDGSAGGLIGFSGGGRNRGPGGLGGGNSGRIIDARDSLQYAFDNFGEGGGGQSGWVLVDADATAESFYVGMVDHPRILITQVDQSSTERYVQSPRGRA